MTEINEQELAEYWAEKFKWEFHRSALHDDRRVITAQKMMGNLFVERDFMFNMPFGPLIAHLIQDYMEGEGFWWSWTFAGKTVYAMYSKGKIEASGYFENKWIANALAARKALENKT